jgi:hypothetical protein
VAEQAGGAAPQSGWLPAAAARSRSSRGRRACRTPGARHALCQDRRRIPAVVRWSVSGVPCLSMSDLLLKLVIPSEATAQRAARGRLRARWSRRRRCRRAAASARGRCAARAARPASARASWPRRRSWAARPARLPRRGRELRPHVWDHTCVHIVRALQPRLLDLRGQGGRATADQSGRPLTPRLLRLTQTVGDLSAPCTLCKAGPELVGVTARPLHVLARHLRASSGCKRAWRRERPPRARRRRHSARRPRQRRRRQCGGAGEGRRQRTRARHAGRGAGRGQPRPGGRARGRGRPWRARVQGSRARVQGRGARIRRRVARWRPRRPQRGPRARIGRRVARSWGLL